MSRSVAFWMAVVASVALFLSAAKAHGRQMRVERELAGFPSVTFRAPNDPWIEAHWRRDRIRFWSAYAVGVALAFAYAAWSARSGAPRPFPGAPTSSRFWSVVLFGGLAWVPAVAFLSAGAQSVVRFARALGDPPAASPARMDPNWATNVLVGSAGWWTLTLALAAVVALAASRPVDVAG